MLQYFRPLAQYGDSSPDGAMPLAGSASWFTHVEVLGRQQDAQIVEASDIPEHVLTRICARRDPIAGLSFDAPVVMGILNVTPDSFSDGGHHVELAHAVRAARLMLEQGADMIDVGGESTRPGAAFVPDDVEIQRTAPVIEALREAEPNICISIDSRKVSVTQAAFAAGAAMANDVSGLSFDAEMAEYIAQTGHPICIMHTQGTPDTMQENPTYENVLLDVYDDLERQIGILEGLGVARAQIIVDPGIGFGKTQSHNLAILKGLSLFHGLGCAILLGVSRKRFIGTIGQAPDPQARAPGSIAIGLDAMRQAVQILRVHDVAETSQALALWRAVTS